MARKRTNDNTTAIEEGVNGQYPGTRDPIASIRTSMESLGQNRDHGMAAIPKSLYFDQTPDIKILQSLSLPAESMAAAASILHGYYRPPNRPSHFPSGALNIYTHNGPARMVWVVGLLHHSVEGGFINKVADVAKGLLALMSRPFRRQMYKQAHYELGDDDRDDLEPSAYS